MTSFSLNILTLCLGQKKSLWFLVIVQLQNRCGHTFVFSGHLFFFVVIIRRAALRITCSPVLFAGLGRAVQQCSERGKTR